jgi:hypothetical protein
MSEQAAVSDVVVLGFIARRRAVMLQTRVDEDGLANMRLVPIAEVDTASMTAEDRQQVQAWRAHYARLDSVV